VTIKSDTMHWDALRVGAKNLIFPPFLKQRTGTLLWSNLQLTEEGTYADIGANLLFAEPFLVCQKLELDRVGVNIAGPGGAGAKLRLGIYSSDENLYPSELKLDAGEVDATTTGWKTLGISLVLKPGIYYVALVSNDSTVDLYWGWVCQMVSLGISQGWRVSQTYGALPATFPAGAITFRSLEVGYRIARYL